MADTNGVVTLNSLKITYSTYNSYVKEFEEKLTEFYNTLNEFYDAISSCAMNKQYWYDDNARDFVNWFRANCGGNDFEKKYTALWMAFFDTGFTTCRLLAYAEPNSYKQYSYIKKYGAGGEKAMECRPEEMFSVLGKRYQKTHIERFNDINTSTKVEVAKADANVIEVMYGIVKKRPKELNTLATEMKALVTKFAQKKAGVDVSGINCTNIIKEIDKCNIDGIASKIASQLEAAIKKTQTIHKGLTIDFQRFTRTSAKK